MSPICSQPEQGLPGQGAGTPLQFLLGLFTPTATCRDAQTAPPLSSPTAAPIYSGDLCPRRSLPPPHPFHRAENGGLVGSIRTACDSRWVGDFLQGCQALPQGVWRAESLSPAARRGTGGGSWEPRSHPNRSLRTRGLAEAPGQSTTVTPPPGSCLYRLVLVPAIPTRPCHPSALTDLHRRRRRRRRYIVTRRGDTVSGRPLLPPVARRPTTACPGPAPAPGGRGGQVRAAGCSSLRSKPGTRPGRELPTRGAPVRGAGDARERRGQGLFEHRQGCCSRSALRLTTPGDLVGPGQQRTRAETAGEARRGPSPGRLGPGGP